MNKPAVNLLLGLMGLSVGAALAALAQPAPVSAPALLPATSYPVEIDGDPREAFLLGARPLQERDAITGFPDGSVRASVLATREGFYVAEISTEPAGTPLVSVFSPSGTDLLQGDWMAVKVVTPAGMRLFVLAPLDQRAVLDEKGLPVNMPYEAWQGQTRRFGHTWAGEWLIPWGALSVPPGERFQLDVLRGRKLQSSGKIYEAVSMASRGQASSRWGGRGLAFAVPRMFPAPIKSPRVLAPFDVRPCIPWSPSLRCEDDVPAGQVATAWLEMPPHEGPVSLTTSGPWPGAEAFLVDFWWQAGTREEQDALFPARVAKGGGDSFCAERLLPQPASGWPAEPRPWRAYVRLRVPESTAPGFAVVTIRVRQGGGEGWTIPWSIRVERPLPPTSALQGVYYLGEDETRWDQDLADIAAHGLNAATYPRADQPGWQRFQAAAKRAGMSGGFALRPHGLAPNDGAMGFAADEPFDSAAVEDARRSIQRLKARGFPNWVSLAWPSALPLAAEASRTAFSLTLLEAAIRGRLTQGQWIYFQGLREDPFYNRLWAGIVSLAGGLSGFWVYAYADDRSGAAEWSSGFIRHDALVESDADGHRVATVEWEALREGILDRRLGEALGNHARRIEASIPAIAAAQAGKYWQVDKRNWNFSRYRRLLLSLWRVDSGKRPAHSNPPETLPTRGGQPAPHVPP